MLFDLAPAVQPNLHVRAARLVRPFQVPFARTVLVWLVVVSLAAAGVPNARDLAREAEKAEGEGEVVRAYLLYAQAAAADPDRPEYWARSQALRTRAALKAKARPVLTGPVKDAQPAPPEPEPIPGFSSEITQDDLADVSRLQPPPELKPADTRRDIDFRGDAKSIYEQVASAWGLEVVFDGEFQPGASTRLRLEDAGFDEALRAAQAATGTFAVPLGEKLMFVAADTPQKRADMEPTVAITIPLPDTASAQEAQELGRAVQQTFDLTKLAVDTTRRMVLLRDRVSKVRPARLVFEQLAAGHAQVGVDVEFLEVDRSAYLAYGFMLPTEFPITWIGPDPKRGVVQSLAKFLFGHSIIGMGIANAQLFAQMNKSHSKLLLRAALRGSEGEPIAFHVGDQYPIATGGLLGGVEYGFFPSFNFENLGLTLNIKPQVHSMEEVSLEVQAEFKVLTGASLNGIPVIANRQFQSRVRLKQGEWAVLSGMMSTDEARAISGLPGVTSVPVLKDLFAKNERNNRSSQVVLLLKPHVMSVPPGDIVRPGVWLGSDARMRIPM